ncbi:MAG: AMIN-like domain-containing (lipo)protein, partial [Longimicrobiales bacterium]
MIRNRIAVALVALLVCGCTPESDDEGRRSARGTATGAVGARADSVLDARATDGALADTARDSEDGDAPTQGSEVAGDTAWIAGSVEVDRDAGAVAVLRDLRVATHDGYDRIVLDFGADAVPGYRIGYVDQPVRACGSGEPVELPGDAWLSIRLSPAAAHDESGELTVRNRDVFAGLPVISGVRAICDFDAVVTWVAGVRVPNTFRVLELTSPN